MYQSGVLLWSRGYFGYSVYGIGGGSFCIICTVARCTAKELWLCMEEPGFVQF